MCLSHLRNIIAIQRPVLEIDPHIAILGRLEAVDGWPLDAASLPHAIWKFKVLSLISISRWCMQSEFENIFSWVDLCL